MLPIIPGSIYARSVALAFVVALLLLVVMPVSSEAAIEGLPCVGEPTDMSASYGDLITCSIQIAGDTDLFRFFGSAGEVIVVYIAWQSGTLRPCIELIAPDNTAQVACVNSFTNRIDTALSQSGTYTIVVNDLTDLGTGPYALSLESLIPPSPPVDQLRYGDILQDELNPAGDIDLFSFSGAAGDTISLQGTWQSGSMRPCVELIAPDNGRLLACANAFSNQIVATLIQTGTHAVLLRDGFGISPGAYTIALQCLTGSCVATGPPGLSLILTGCTICNPGIQLVVEGRLTNRGSQGVAAELKLGWRLPDGTPSALFGPAGRHFDITVPANFDQTFPLLNFTWAEGLPTGTWTLEATLLEIDLGKTFSRDVKPFQVVP
jgi:hypothetical protein